MGMKITIKVYEEIKSAGDLIIQEDAVIWVEGTTTYAISYI